MRILMLGWEFPPYIAGGLGTACFGLTRALDRLGHDVLFVLPREADGITGDRVRVVGPNAIGPAVTGQSASTEPEEMQACPEMEDSSGSCVDEAEDFVRTRFVSVPSGRRSPYPAFASEEAGSVEQIMQAGRSGAASVGAASVTTKQRLALAEVGIEAPAAGDFEGSSPEHYGHDMIGDAKRYARLIASLAETEDFDVIHAHDWMTYAAGAVAARLSGKPLVAHVHSTEFDRSGESVNQTIYDLERLGMHAADRIIAVSRLTKSICEQRYGVDGRKIQVVYNGIDDDRIQPEAGGMIASTDKIVLFLGRITMQKGPEYFVRAARRVLDKYDDVKFVVAGSGDMAVGMIEEAATLGIGHKVLFTGFLRGRDVDRVFQMADCYVMPSVSEPFGIAPLEAMKNDVPVIISKQSGVSEVLTHALKVDFWDIDEMANKIIAVLRHPPLSQTLRQHGPMELRRLTWEDAARRTASVYEAVRSSTLVR
ncbi:MAG TPA: glycosyltransferase [Phycisphaerales bacterium]|nr:glycosyltransferase [Phycisphaerales bacterium]